MEKIIIVSRNKGIVSKEELLPFAILLRDSLFVPVEFNTPQHLGTQVTLHDVIEVWINLKNSKLLDITLTAFVEEIIKSFVKWSKKRLFSEKQKRPKSLSIYDNQRNRIKSITINIEGEVEDNSQKEQIFTPTPPKVSETFFGLNSDDEKKDKEK